MRRRWVESGWECRMIWTPWFVWEDPRVELMSVEWSVVFVILLFATMILRPQYCMSCVFAVYSVNDVQVKWVINKNPREVVLIVLIIPIVFIVALIIPVVYPIIIVILIITITMVTLTIQLNTISTVTTVTLLIIQLWHFFYSSEGADAETAPTIPN